MAKDQHDPGTIDILDPSMVGTPKYERRENDFYETPEWVTEVLLRHVRFGQIWEPACGHGAMQRVFDAAGVKSIGTDLPNDFLKLDAATAWDIVTNPPYKQAEEFVRHALTVTKTHKRKVAMVLRNEWDSAHTRRDLFNAPPFAMKIVLTRRPQWIAGKLKASPRHNFSIFVWDWHHKGAPILVYDR